MLSYRKQRTRIEEGASSSYGWIRNNKEGFCLITWWERLNCMCLYTLEGRREWKVDTSSLKKQEIKRCKQLWYFPYFSLRKTEVVNYSLLHDLPKDAGKGPKPVNAKADRVKFELIWDMGQSHTSRDMSSHLFFSTLDFIFCVCNNLAHTESSRKNICIIHATRGRHAHDWK